MRKRAKSNQLHRLRKDKKAVTPAISSAIITSAVIVMILVTISFANGYLGQRIAENEFSSMKQFMQTTGLQLDDVAWTVGRTQTVRYASTYGEVYFESPALNYTVLADGNPVANFSTGMILFNMPSVKYNLGNNYHERIIPSANRNFLQQGTSGPVSQVFVVEIVPMNDGNYIRIVVAPSIRMLNSTITTGGTTLSYYNFYLPLLEQGSSHRLSQSVTLQGTTVNVQTTEAVSNVTILVDFPMKNLGFNAQFFGFDSLEEDISVPSGSVLQFYTSEVIVSLGLQG
jgi:hypothetical protein